MVDKLKLEVKSAVGLTRTAAPTASGPLANAKFLDALFGNDAIRNKRNTEAVETGPSQLVSGRIVQYAPARLLPLADVSAKVRERVVSAQASALARKDGEARLAALKAAPQTELVADAQVVSRAQAKDLPRPLLDAVLRAPSTSLPAFIGVDLAPQGYAVVKLVKVLGRDPVASDMVQAQTQYLQAWSAAEAQAYYNALKSRFKVDVKAAAASASSPTN